MPEAHKGWLDVTWPLRNDMVHWPGQPPVRLERLSSMEEGGHSNVTALSTSVHAGTHMDAPVHFLQDGADITAVPLDAMLGSVRVASVAGAVITPAGIEGYESRSGRLLPGERIFFRTANSESDWLLEPFHEDYVAVNAAAARLLASRGILVVGIDYLSVAPFGNTAETHRILLRAGVWIIEGLDLRLITEGHYGMLALPLKLTGSDASPLRVLLRPAGREGREDD